MIVSATKAKMKRQADATELARLRREDYKHRFEVARETARCAVKTTRACIRKAIAQTPWPRWNLLTFCGPDGGEARGVVDLLAIRKDHGLPRIGTKRGDTFQIILIQIKGGAAARPTAEDGTRLRAVAHHYRAREALLATWEQGEAVRFHSLRPRAISGKGDWVAVSDLKTIFR